MGPASGEPDAGSGSLWYSNSTLSFWIAALVFAEHDVRSQGKACFLRTLSKSKEVGRVRRKTSLASHDSAALFAEFFPENELNTKQVSTVH